MLDEFEPTLCIYHGDCSDGFGAAWAIWKRWPDCKFVPAYYGKPLPDVTDEHVIFVDFSPPLDWYWTASMQSKRMVIIDHHKTSKAAMDRLFQFDGTMNDLLRAFRETWNHGATPEAAVWFDMTQSGCSMAWKFAHPGEAMPDMLTFIEDRDLWRFRLKDQTKEFCAGLDIYPMDFEVWNEVAADPDPLFLEGKIALRVDRNNVKKILAEVYQDDVGGFTVPVCNCNYFYASDVGHALVKQFPEAPFSATWFKRADGKEQWSLRSDDDREDVSAVAKSMGGGGHRNASGFEKEPSGSIAIGGAGGSGLGGGRGGNATVQGKGGVAIGGKGGDTR